VASGQWTEGKWLVTSGQWTEGKWLVASGQWSVNSRGQVGGWASGLGGQC
jgi:hypothetical protein